MKTNILSAYPKYRRSHIQGLCYVELVQWIFSSHFDIFFMNEHFH